MSAADKIAGRNAIIIRAPGSVYQSPRGLKALALAVLTIQNTSLVLITKYSYRPTTTPYLVSTVIVCAEIIKFILSYVLLITADGQSAAREAVREVPSIAVRLVLPSVLYVLQNNLLFIGIRLLTPMLYMVCTQSKIVTSALWSVVLLGTQITRKQYAALSLLIFGMIMVQGGEELYGKASANAQISRASDTLYGTIVVVVAAFTSGFAGAYLERIYKETGSQKRSIWFQNTQLACVSFPVAVIAVCWQDGERLRKHSIFRGYDGIVLVMILLQAVGGLIVAMVLRYASNILKCFAVCISICNCAIATTCLSGEIMSTFTIFGILLVIGSTLLYSNVI